MSEEDSSPANIRKVCEESLRRLGVETLAIFYQHRADPNTPIEIVAETVKELIREGKVRHFGLCEVNADTIRRAHAIQPVTAIQSEYHLMHRAVEKSILPLCGELGIGFVPYSPLNRGFLGGSLNEYTVFDAANDNRQTLPRFTPEAMRANLRIVEVLHAFGRTRGITAAQIALAWLLNKKPWIVPHSRHDEARPSGGKPVCGGHPLYPGGDEGTGGRRRRNPHRRQPLQRRTGSQSAELTGGRFPESFRRGRQEGGAASHSLPRISAFPVQTEIFPHFLKKHH